MPKSYVAVVGPDANRCSPDEAGRAEAVGRRLAEAGAVVVCGGLGGAMEAACRGAKAAGGTTLGILPGRDRSSANRFVDVAVATGVGEARNTIVVSTVDAVVAVGGGHGTLSEIAFALKLGRRVIGLGTWDVAGVEPAAGPEDAVARALRPG